MKCPKCHYLSFEPSPRCRNCGFDLGISDVEVAIRPSDETDAPAADLELHPKRRAAPRRAPKTLGLIHPAREPERPRESAAAVAVAPPPVPLPAQPVAFQDVPLRIERMDRTETEVPAVVGLGRREPIRPQAAAAAVQAQPQTPGELPLFVKGLLSGPARPPLGVRRAAPELVKPKPLAPTPPRPPGPFDRDLMEDLKRVEAEEQVRDAGEPATEVGRTTRFAALAADWSILLAIGSGVVWASLKVADAQLGDLTLQAVIPLAAFLLLISFSYFILFTIGNGQTPGKMAMQIRVVDTSGLDSQPPSPRQALYRTLLAAASGLLLGVGFLPALGERGVAAPDRFTQTRTVRA